MENKRNYSPKRQAILNVLLSTKEHPTVEWVVAEVRKQYPNISVATVYRNIAQLKEDGHVVAVGTVEGHERLDGTTKNHPHFICRNCGAVIDVSLTAEEDAMCHSINEQYGMSAERCDITFWCCCSKCQK